MASVSLFKPLRPIILFIMATTTLIDRANASRNNFYCNENHRNKNSSAEQNITTHRKLDLTTRNE